jgi:hypothetical protein
MRKRVLIAVKTYPSLSEKYNELVCTAGFLDDGSWIRLYPIQFRMLNDNQQYPKYSIVELDVVKNTSDHRVESYRPVNISSSLQVVGILETDNEWAQRRNIVLRNATNNLAQLIQRSISEHISLAVYKPAQVLDFVWEKVPGEWDKNKLEKVKSNLKQLNLFEEHKEATTMFRVVRKLPYKFSYRFTDIDGKPHKLMIEDWELGALFWKCIDKGDSEQEACEKVKNKYFDWMCKRDLYFYLGTTLAHPNTFIIIGTFYPPVPKPKVLSLFD